MKMIASHDMLSVVKMVSLTSAVATARSCNVMVTVPVGERRKRGKGEREGGRHERREGNQGEENENYGRKFRKGIDDRDREREEEEKSNGEKKKGGRGSGGEDEERC